MLDKVVELAPVALMVLGGLVAALAAVAPLTKTDVDNKVLDALRKAQELVARLIGVKAAK